jgi:hypothetical protein
MKERFPRQAAHKPKTPVLEIPSDKTKSGNDNKQGRSNINHIGRSTGFGIPPHAIANNPKNERNALTTPPTTKALKRSTNLVLIGVPAGSAPKPVEVFEHIGVQHRRADLVDARGPLAQVDFAAAIAAEREVLVFWLYEHST